MCENLKIDISCCFDFNNSKLEEYYNTNITPINWLSIKNQCNEKNNEIPKWINCNSFNKYRSFGLSITEHNLLFNTINNSLEQYIEILKFKNEFDNKHICNYISLYDSFITIPLYIKSELYRKYNI